jgi:uncharacterized protein
MVEAKLRDAGIFLTAILCGVVSGLVGIGGGVLLVPLLVLIFAFGQHRAQGTSLIALIPPTGILAFLMYARSGHVAWLTGALLIPGVFLGGILGAHLVNKIEPLRLRRLFAAILFALGAWQAVSAWTQ